MLGPDLRSRLQHGQRCASGCWLGAHNRQGLHATKHGTLLLASELTRPAQRGPLHAVCHSPVALQLLRRQPDAYADGLQPLQQRLQPDGAGAAPHVEQFAEEAEEQQCLPQCTAGGSQQAVDKQPGGGESGGRCNAQGLQQRLCQQQGARRLGCLFNCRGFFGNNCPCIIRGRATNGCNCWRWRCLLQAIAVHQVGGLVGRAVLGRRCCWVW